MGVTGGMMVAERLLYSRFYSKLFVVIAASPCVVPATIGHSFMQSDSLHREIPPSPPPTVHFFAPKKL